MIHGFWVPQLAGKVQLIPAHVNHITILPVVPGTYLGVCANFCGEQHAKMHFLVIVEPSAQFAAWFANQLKPAAQAGRGAGRGGGEPPSPRCRAAAATPSAAPPCNGTYGPDLTHLASRTLDRRRHALQHPGEPAPLDRRPAAPSSPARLMPTIPILPQTLSQIVAYLDELK